MTGITFTAEKDHNNVLYYGLLPDLPLVGEPGKVYFVTDSDGNGTNQSYVWSTTSNAYEDIDMPQMTWRVVTTPLGIVDYCATNPTDQAGTIIQFTDGSTWVLKTGGNPATFTDWLKIEQQGGVYRWAIFDNGLANLADFIAINPVGEIPGTAYRFLDGSIYELRQNGDPLVTADWIAVNADFWRKGTGTTRPDNLNDTTADIAHDGNVTIGNPDPTYTAPTGASATNSHLNLSENATDKTQLMKTNAPLIYSMSRVIPTVVNDTVGICSLSGIGSASHTFRMSIVVQDVGFATSKIYEFAGKWNGYATTRVLKPIIDGGAYAGNDFQVLISVVNQTLTLTLRRTSGAVAGTALIKLESAIAYDQVITELTATGTDATVYTLLDLLPIDQEVIQGATSPLINDPAPAGAKYFYNTTLHKTTRAVEAGLYVAISNEENIVDFAVNADPNTAGTTFVPNVEADTDVHYRSIINDNVWIYNGTKYVPVTSINPVITTGLLGYPSLNVITHNLGTFYTSVTVREVSGQEIDVKPVGYTENTVTLQSAVGHPAVEIYIVKHTLMP